MSSEDLAGIEYRYLREHILANQRLMWQAISFSVATTLLLLSYAYHLHVTDGSETASTEALAPALVSMLPWLVILGSLSLLAQTRREIFELGAYIRLFYEQGEANPCYETRLDRVRDKRGKGAESHTRLVVAIMVLLSVFTTASSVYFVRQHFHLWVGWLAAILTVVALIWLVRSLAGFVDVPSPSNRRRYREKWRRTEQDPE